jgi:hypothetical protein
MTQKEIEKEAWERYWKLHPNIIVNENSRPEFIIGYIDAIRNSKYFKNSKIKHRIKPRKGDYFETEAEGDVLSTTHKGLTWRQVYEKDLKKWNESKLKQN